MRRTAAVLAMGVLLGGCSWLGTSSAPTAVRDGGAPSRCGAVPRVTALVVLRHADGTGRRFTFPATVAVTSPTAARGVARAACALPRLTGAHHCPMQLDVTYTLAFKVRGMKGLGGYSVELNPTGCETLTGLGPTRWLQHRQGFYRRLGDALSLTTATQPTFAGS